MKKFKVVISGSHEWERIFEVEAMDKEDAEDKADTLFTCIYEDMTFEQIAEEVSLYQKEGELLGVSFNGDESRDWQDKDYDVEEKKNEATNT